MTAGAVVHKRKIRSDINQFMNTMNWCQPRLAPAFYYNRSYTAFVYALWVTRFVLWVLCLLHTLRTSVSWGYGSVTLTVSDWCLTSMGDALYTCVHTHHIGNAGGTWHKNFQTGKCPFASCPIFIKWANARCPLPDNLCPFATLVCNGDILTFWNLKLLATFLWNWCFFTIFNARTAVCLHFW